MLAIEVIHSSDPNRIGKYQFEKNQIFIGSNYSSDIYFPNTNLKKDHLFVEIIEDKILIHLGSDVKHIKVNGKRTTTFKYLKREDTFTLEDEEFRIKDFFKTTHVPAKEKLNSITKDLSSDSDIFKIINTLNNLRKDEK